MTQSMFIPQVSWLTHLYVHLCSAVTTTCFQFSSVLMIPCASAQLFFCIKYLLYSCSKWLISIIHLKLKSASPGSCPSLLIPTWFKSPTFFMAIIPRISIVAITTTYNNYLYISHFYKVLCRICISESTECHTLNKCLMTTFQGIFINNRFKESALHSKPTVLKKKLTFSYIILCL